MTETKRKYIAYRKIDIEVIVDEELFNEEYLKTAGQYLVPKYKSDLVENAIRKIINSLLLWGPYTYFDGLGFVEVNNSKPLKTDGKDYGFVHEFQLIPGLKILMDDGKAYEVKKD